MGHVSADEADQILIRFNNSHFNNTGEQARYSIPADPRRDDDIRLAVFIDQYRELKRLATAVVEAWENESEITTMYSSELLDHVLEELTAYLKEKP